MLNSRFGKLERRALSKHVQRVEAGPDAAARRVCKPRCSGRRRTIGAQRLYSSATRHIAIAIHMRTRRFTVTRFLTTQLQTSVHLPPPRQSRLPTNAQLPMPQQGGGVSVLTAPNKKTRTA